jgi:hypothetical protein
VTLFEFAKGAAVPLDERSAKPIVELVDLTRVVANDVEQRELLARFLDVLLRECAPVTACKKEVAMKDDAAAPAFVARPMRAPEKSREADVQGDVP